MTSRKVQQIFDHVRSSSYINLRKYLDISFTKSISILVSMKMPHQQSEGTHGPVAHYSAEVSQNALQASLEPYFRSHVAADIYRIDVWFINVDTSSSFQVVRIGHDGTTHDVLNQVAKHVARGLYRLINLTITECQCMVTFSTQMSREDLMWKNGFPWDAEEDPQPDVVLKTGDE